MTIRASASLPTPLIGGNLSISYAEESLRDAADYRTLAAYHGRTLYDRLSLQTSFLLDLERGENNREIATGSITVNRSVSAPYSIAISGGANGDTSATTREMASGSSRITYGLYRDAGRATGWYNDAGNVRSGTATGAAQVYPVYGRVRAQPTPSPGSYTDTGVVTLTY